MLGAVAEGSVVFVNVDLPEDFGVSKHEAAEVVFSVGIVVGFEFGGSDCGDEAALGGHGGDLVGNGIGGVCS